MRRLRQAVGAAMVGVVMASPASAQFERRPTQAGPTLDSVRVVYASRPVWRGFLLGRNAVTADLDIALGGYATTAAGNWALALRAGGTAVGDAPPGSASPGHVEGVLAVSRRFSRSADAAALELTGGGYWIPDQDTAATGVDVGLRLTRLQWSWGLEERNPTLELAVHRDFGRFDGFRAEAAFDLGMGGQILALGIFDGADIGLEGRVWAWAFDDGLGRDQLGGRAGLVASFEKSWLAFVFRGGLVDPVDATRRGYFEAGVRIWPDADTSFLPGG